MTASIQLRSLLVHVDASPASVQRVRLARMLGYLHAARVQALYAATPAADGQSYQHDEGRVRSDIERGTAEGGWPVEWLKVKAAESTLAFRERALTADLLVLGQRHPTDSRAFDVPADFVEATAAACGRPCLVLPHRWLVPEHASRTALVAWKPTRESAAALHGALPLLRQAEQVHLVTWDEDAPRRIQAQQQVVEALRLHGIDGVERHAGAEPPDPGTALLTLAASVGADLLVMGCYSHGRARELALGGASRTVLRQMHLPVLTAH